MKSSTRAHWILSLLALLSGACSVNRGEPGSSDVADLPITGTVYTIVFENHSQDAVMNPDNPYIMDLKRRYGTADAYLGELHPSLPNYIIMTSGDTHGIDDDGAPSEHQVDGNEHLADQLDAAKIPWRAYMEDMGDPCKLEDAGEYAVRHNPFAYYSSLTDDTERCREHVVDMHEHFAEDLAADEYRYMWITPNECNDMHDCSTQTSDEWLRRVIPQIMESPGYKKGGAIFLLWDEGSEDASYATWYVAKNPQNIPFVLISENIVSPGFVSNTTYGHDSYLATVQDAFGLPRLPTTVDSTPMADFFGGTPAVEAHVDVPSEVDAAPPEPADGAPARVGAAYEPEGGAAQDPEASAYDPEDEGSRVDGGSSEPVDEQSPPDGGSYDPEDDGA